MARSEWVVCVRTPTHQYARGLSTSPLHAFDDEYLVCCDACVALGEQVCGDDNRRHRHLPHAGAGTPER